MSKKTFNCIFKSLINSKLKNGDVQKYFAENLEGII